MYKHIAGHNMRLPRDLNAGERSRPMFVISKLRHGTSLGVRRRKVVIECFRACLTIWAKNLNKFKGPGGQNRVL